MKRRITGQITAILFIYLLLSADAYRLDALGKLQTKSRSRSSSRGLSRSFAYANSTLTTKDGSGFVGVVGMMAGAMGAGVPAVSATTAAGNAIIAASGSIVTGVCAPGLTAPTAAIAVGSTVPAMAIVWPILVAVAVVALAGLITWAIWKSRQPPPPAFCPISSWEADPIDDLIGPSFLDSFPQDLPSFLGEDNDRGMPRCKGLRKVKLKDHGCDDVDCFRQKCRQRCCDTKSCSFFQFTENDNDLYCWLGKKTQLTQKNCAAPYLGEVCTSCQSRRVPLWKQIGKDRSKCVSATIGYTGFKVLNQYECQAAAEDEGHTFYQYDHTKKKCATTSTCDNPMTGTIHLWKIFSRNAGAGTQDVSQAGSVGQATWVFEPLLFHQVKNLQTVVPNAIACDTTDAVCMKLKCRQTCEMKEWCIYYQFQEGINECHLSHENVVQETKVTPWYGGILAEKRSCDEHVFKCRSNNECVSDCSECPGFGMNGEPSEKKGEGKWCLRNAVQNMCYADNWEGTHKGTNVGEWCKGLEKLSVTLDEDIAEGQTGADLCSIACCNDPSCVLYQVKDKEGTKTAWKKGDTLTCWLGLEDNYGKARFSCTGRSPKRWRMLASPVAAALRQRGCTDGTLACVATSQCVDFCNECPSHSKVNLQQNNCEPDRDPVDPRVPTSPLYAEGLPPVDNNPDDFYTICETPPCPTGYVPDVLSVLEANIRKMVGPNWNGDVTAICDGLGSQNEAGVWDCEYDDGKCICNFDEEHHCDMWFDGIKQLKPVLEDDGMLVFGGDGCSCEEEKGGGWTCGFEIMENIPPIKGNMNDQGALLLKNKGIGKCEPRNCPNMDACEPIGYGNFGCGYACTQGATEFWCSDECSCNTEQAVDPNQSNCGHDHVCPGYDSCDVISYGDYGCGYGCMKKDVYYFCSDQCSCNT